MTEMASTWFRILLVILAAATWSCAEKTTPRVEMIPSPARVGSGQARLVVGGDGKLYLSWIESQGGEHVFKFCRWQGNAWSPSRVIARGNDWVVNWADVPGLTVLADGKTIMAHWLVQMGEGEAYGIRIARSLDAGNTWSLPIAPHQDSTKTEHGFGSWHPISADRAAFVWLDGRETVRGGPTTLRYTSLAVDGTLADEMVVDSRVCDCCPTDLAGEGSSLVVAYRDRSEEEIRDIRLARYESGAWKDGPFVHRDAWKIAGCPVNGPAVAMRGDVLAVAWFTADSNDHGHVRLALSQDRGRTFQDPVEISAYDPLGRVGVALAPDSTVWVLWMESGKDGRAELRLRHQNGAGSLDDPITVGKTSGSRKSGIPRLAWFGGDLFVAWTNVSNDNAPEAASVVLTARVR